MLNFFFNYNSEAVILLSNDLLDFIKTSSTNVDAFTTSTIHIFNTILDKTYNNVSSEFVKIKHN